jgi:hypothetical protein
LILFSIHHLWCWRICFLLHLALLALDLVMYSLSFWVRER